MRSPWTPCTPSTLTLPTCTNARPTAVAKKNHPGLHDKVRCLPWGHRLDHYERSRAHHRDEIRWLKIAAFAHLDYPHACQALQFVRRRRDLAASKLTLERIYLVTSLPSGVATGTELAA
ncbi:hypothetical protein ABZ580_32825 [Streptomyces sp. NPDC012486]|uniref:hypothetical protein n=1 Tax=Streptomyces sp. NPDC012486 TaxID=3156669 RepID=UPI0033CBA158